MNTPNKITLARILLIPFVIFFYVAGFIPYGRFIAAAIFVIACLTDFVDGKIARKYNQVTTLGKFFDSIADKVLIMTGMILVVTIPLRGVGAAAQPVIFTSICMIIMLAREFIISALRQLAASKGIVLAADKGGKIKAAFQDVTICLYMFYAAFIADTNLLVAGNLDPKDPTNIANAVVNIILLILLSISTILTITSGVSYILKNKKVFKETQEKDVDKQPQKVEFKKVERKNLEKKYDELIPEGMKIFWETGWASTTLLQKKLSVGYPRASKMIVQMEELKLISPIENKTRKVLVTKEEFEKNFSAK